MINPATQQKVVVLLDRMTPEAREDLIERFVLRDLDRLIKLTTLRAKLAEAKWQRQESGPKKSI